MNKIISTLLKLVFPNRCVICDAILPFGFRLENEHLCRECRKRIEFIKEPYCKKCGAMINDENELYCTRCIGHIHESFDYGFGLCRYNDSVKKSIHRIKYSGRKEYIDFYGKCIAKMYHDKIKNMNIDYLIPVPIHSKRLRERNYNQATVLAYSISNELKKYSINVDVNEKVIYRTKNTKVLNKLDNASRQNELKGAFITGDLSDTESVMIVDIRTTKLIQNKVSHLKKVA